MHGCSSCSSYISWFTTTAPDQLEGDPPRQIMEGVDQEEEDDPEGRHDVEEIVELLERDGLEEQDQSVEPYSNSNAAASDGFEEEEDLAGPRPHTEGRGDSEERLNLSTAVEETGGRSNTAQSDLVVSF